MSSLRLPMSCVAYRSIAIGIPRRHLQTFSIPLSSRRSFRWRAESATPPSDPEMQDESSDAEKREIRSFALDEMLEEVSDTQSLGSRGEGWMLSMLLAWVLLFFPPVNLFGLITATGWILTAGGIVLFISGLLSLRRNNFPLPYPRKEAALVQQGIYAHVRHPQYGGILLLCLGISAITRNETRGVFCMLLWFVMERLVEFEERVLRARFEDYAAYCEGTRKFIPGVY